MRPSNTISKALSAIDFQTAINLAEGGCTSELAVQTVMNAMRATGLAGYRNDTDVSIGRSPARCPVVAHHDQQ